MAFPVPQGSLSGYLDEISKYPLLTPEQEHEFAMKYWKDGDVDAAHRLVTANLRFVVKVAREYGSYGVRMSDLVQEGNIGLMLAVKKFDPTRGNRLLSYAVWWIRAMMQSFILKTWSLVKIGTTQAQRKLFYKLSQTRRALTAMGAQASDLPGEPSAELLAKALNVRSDDIEEMDARMRARDASLDAPLTQDGSTTALDLLPSPDNQEERMAKAQEKDQVNAHLEEALTGLNEKERFIVEKRIMHDEPMTLQEIGDHYHISRERARQLEERAKRKIRTVLESAGIH